MAALEPTSKALVSQPLHARDDTLRESEGSSVVTLATFESHSLLRNVRTHKRGNEP